MLNRYISSLISIILSLIVSSGCTSAIAEDIYTYTCPAVSNLSYNNAGGNIWYGDIVVTHNHKPAGTIGVDQGDDPATPAITFEGATVAADESPEFTCFYKTQDNQEGYLKTQDITVGTEGGIACGFYNGTECASGNPDDCVLTCP